MKGLTQGTAEGAFLMYAAHLNKMEMNEFLLFAKVSVQYVCMYVQHVYVYIYSVCMSVYMHMYVIMSSMYVYI